ncbi:MAG: hypothetical protein AAFQ98_04925 [Bacteroidota bacterium]
MITNTFSHRLGLLACLVLFTGFASYAQSSSQEYLLKLHRPEEDLTLTFAKGSRIYYTLTESPEDWQRGVLVDINPQGIVVAKHKWKSPQVTLPLHRIKTVEKRRVISDVAKGFEIFLGTAGVAGTVLGLTRYTRTEEPEYLSFALLSVGGALYYTGELLLPAQHHDPYYWEVSVVSPSSN